METQPLLFSLPISRKPKPPRKAVNLWLPPKLIDSSRRLARVRYNISLSEMVEQYLEAAVNDSKAPAKAKKK